MAVPSESRLFQPLTVGKMPLRARIGMAPLTRFRASTTTHVATPMMAEYYSQRASVPGTLLVTEGVFISAEQAGYDCISGIFTPAQIAAWRTVTDAVHARGSFISCQLWALGRATSPTFAKEQGLPILSSSAVPIPVTWDFKAGVTPTEMTEGQIAQTIRDYAAAAKNAIEGAGFDCVEIHGANGYLVDQFTQDVCNRRTDKWGGSVENRSRFGAEVVKAVCEAVGPERVGIRLSPWSTWQGMKMSPDEKVVEQFSDLITRIADVSGGKMAYLHLVESVIAGIDDAKGGESLDFAMNLWKEKTQSALLVAGGYSPETVAQLVDEKHPDKNVVVIFGRYFISTPDLVFRIRNGLPLTPYDKNTFYTPQKAEGYTDWPFGEDFKASGILKA